MLRVFHRSAWLLLLSIASWVGQPPHRALATHYFFDVNGTNGGSGVVDGGSYSWESAVWNSSSNGTGTPINWPDGNNFPEFAAGSDANGKSYTITANANHVFAGMALQNNGGGNGAGKSVTIAGASGVVLTLFTSSPPAAQGVFVGGTSDQNLVITATIGGDATTPLVWQGRLSGSSGSLYLYGNNTFSGGVDLNTNAGLNFNNPNSFGTGPIRWGYNASGGTQFAIAAPDATVPISIGNAMQTKSNSTLIMSDFAEPVTWGGAWVLDTGTSTLDVRDNVDTTISGIISGTDGSSALAKISPGKLILSNANTYAGGTTISAGDVELAGASAKLGTGNVTVSGSGTSLTIDSGVSNALNESATLNLGGFATMNLGSGINDRISTLVLDGAQQPNGTYGSSQSDAVNKLDFYFSGTGILTVGPSILAGDYNNDGIVNAADYVVWRKNVGQPAQTLPNDTTGVIVGNAQYDLWRSNFGNASPAPGAGASLGSSPVPEPSLAGLLIIGFAALRFSMRNRGVQRNLPI
ncbi:MAG TPA: autotransporter-associated beta strand repeat-containing protein [Lacipirellulaceae bacterium]|nr:autotransporter-associated beta strand repeat-containing protein [Lacipirellulaceae bacterium]